MAIKTADAPPKAMLRINVTGKKDNDNKQTITIDPLNIIVLPAVKIVDLWPKREKHFYLFLL